MYSIDTYQIYFPICKKKKQKTTEANHKTQTDQGKTKT